MKITAGKGPYPWQHLTVLCDGLELRYCLSADPEHGEAVTDCWVEVAPARWEQDSSQFESAVRLHRGRITFRVPPERGAAIIEEFPALARYIEPYITTSQ